MESVESAWSGRRKFLDEVSSAEALHYSIRKRTGWALVRKMKEKRITCEDVVDSLHEGLHLSKSFLRGALSYYRQGHQDTGVGESHHRIMDEINEFGKAKTIPYEGSDRERIKAILRFVNGW